MSAKTKIQWTDSTFNPWIGCTKVGPGCDNCYAERAADKRLHRATWGAGQFRSLTSPANWKKPLQWNRRPFYECRTCAWRGDRTAAAPDVRCPDCLSANLTQVRRRVFCASWADVFDNEAPQSWRQDLFNLISHTSNLDWLLLTKRIGNVGDMVARAYMPSNVWLGATVCNQLEAERDIPKLLATQARVKFLSIEPLLGPIDFAGMWVDHTNPAVHQNVLEALDWVIVGGESGPGARPMHPAWVRLLRDQCAAVDTPFLFKQWGEWGRALPRPAGTEGRFAIASAPPGGELWPMGVYETSSYPRAFNLFGGSTVLERVGMKAAGRLLDGRTWSEFPSPDGRVADHA